MGNDRALQAIVEGAVAAIKQGIPILLCSFRDSHKKEGLFSLSLE